MRALSLSYVWMGACDWQESLDVPTAGRQYVPVACRDGNQLRAIFVGLVLASEDSL